MAALCPAVCDYEMESHGVLVSRAKLVTSLLCSVSLVGIIGVRLGGSLKGSTVQSLTKMESTESFYPLCVGLKQPKRNRQGVQDFASFLLFVGEHWLV